jgi:Domain of unknown function (DUF4159)
MIKRVGAGTLILILLFAGQAIPDRVPKEHAEYVFARVKFHMNVDAIFQREAAWHHDYPYSEDFFLGMVSEVSGIHTSVDAYQIVELDSPDIFKYPFLYFSEPGFLDLTDDELKNLREYFNRGGFAMFDDFRGSALLNLEQEMLRVFPDRKLVRLDLKEPIFRSFYEIESLEMPPPYRNFDSGEPSFWGMKDDKDRLILVANADNDFGEFWEDIDHGREALRPSVQSFQFGVNYLIYAMTH